MPAQNKRDPDKPREIKLFNPGKDFPAISISGNRCELDCAHCSGQYLKQMRSVASPDELIKVCTSLAARHANGVLISGGSDSKGHVMIDTYFDALTEIKQRTDLVINVHTGLMDQTQARQLAETGIDVVSVDIAGDKRTIKNVFGLNYTPDDYRNNIVTLRAKSVKRIVPHICIGLDFGQVSGEFHAIDLLSDLTLAALVLIIMVPTPGARMARCKPPEASEVMRVFRHAQTTLGDSSIYLGCMRPRTKEYREYMKDIEYKVINAGIDGIVLPSTNAVRYIKEQGIKINNYNTCCAVE